MSKKVAVLLDNSFKSDNRVEKGISSFVNAGCSVTLYCEYDKGVALQEKHNYNIERIFRPSYKKLFSKGFNEVINQLADVILSGSPDIVYCHDIITINIGVAIKQKNGNIVLAYDTHEYFRGLPYYKNSKGLLAKIKGFLFMQRNLKNEAVGINMADLVVTVVDSIAEKLSKDYQLGKKPITVLNTPNEIKEDLNTNVFLKEALGLDEKDILIAQLGGIYVSDVIFNQFLTICEHNNFKCVFIGNTKRHQELKTQFKNSDSFFVYPYGSQKENISVLKTVDIGLFIMDHSFLSYKITLPNRFFEYAYAELPIISFQSEGLKTITKYFQNTQYINDINELSEAVVYCENNKDTLVEESINIKNNYYWEKEFEKVLDALDINNGEKLSL